MHTSREDHTSEYRLTEKDMEGDLDTTVREEELDSKGKPLIDWVKPVEWLLPNAETYEEWEEDEIDKDVEIIDLYDSGDENGNDSEDSDEVYGEEELGMETDESEGEYDDEDEGEDEQDESDGGRRKNILSHSLSLRMKMLI